MGHRSPEISSRMPCGTGLKIGLSECGTRKITCILLRSDMRSSSMHLVPAFTYALSISSMCSLLGSKVSCESVPIAPTDPEGVNDERESARAFVDSLRVMSVSLRMAADCIFVRVGTVPLKLTCCVFCCWKRFVVSWIRCLW